MMPNLEMAEFENLQLRQEIEILNRENKKLKSVLEFYADQNHWMRLGEKGDHQLLVAHGKNFDGTSNGWVEAENILNILKISSSY